MGLLKGPTGLTTFNVTKIMPEVDFNAARFTEIPAGSEQRQAAGFIPFEPDVAYQVGAKRWAFRLRLDQLKADQTALRELVATYVRAELDAGVPFVSARKKKELRDIAEAELVIGAQPKTSIVECVIDGSVLYVGSVSDNLLGFVMSHLRTVGVEVAAKTPWIDRGQESSGDRG